MYTHYFHLKQSPFSIAPDPRYLFMSERHREALAHLLYGVGSGGGFVLLTGEIGAGKTTVCRCFMEQIPDSCRLAYIFNPKLTVEELLLSICDEFRIPAPLAPSVKGYVDAINGYLLASHAQGKNNVLVIDEAQNLSAAVLEQLRLLTNLETSERKLLQIILIGQPELRTMLARPELEQLAQRVIARYHLGPLSEADTGAYIGHRLAVAGASALVPFGRALIPQIHQLSKGVPRRINLLCDRALLGAYVENQAEVSPAILRKAAAEVFADDRAQGVAGARVWPKVAAGVVSGAVLAAAWQILPRTQPVAPPLPVAKARASVAPVPRPAPVAAPKAPPPLPVVDVQQGVRELASLWQQPLAAGDACQNAARAGLRCHQGRGGLYELRQIDRPAVLALRDGAQAVRYVVLFRLDDVNATIAAGGVEQTLPVASLATRFDGSFITLWKMARHFRDQIGAGERGPDVDWLAARLAQVQGAKAPPPHQPLGPVLARGLRQFQQAQNLKSDGVAGPRTFMRLNQMTGVAEPHLLVATSAATSSGGK